MNTTFLPINADSYASFFPKKTTKSSDTRMKILEGAIKSFALNGIERTTYAQIAKHSGVSRSLLAHYYESLDEIFFKSVQLTVYKFLNHLQEHDENLTATSKLKLFVSSYINWGRKNSHETQLLLLLSFISARNPKYKLYHTQLTLNALEHVIQILKMGNKSGEFDCSQSKTTARLILTQLIGVSQALWTTDILSPDTALKETWNYCHNLTRGNENEI